LLRIVAQELGIATDDVHVVSADTDTTPMDTGAIASRTTYVTGNAARLAAEKCKLMMFDVAAPMLGVKPNQLEARTSHRGEGLPQRKAHIGDVANHARVVTASRRSAAATSIPRPWRSNPETGQGKPFATYVYATQIAEVEVDEETGETEVLRITRPTTAARLLIRCSWKARLRAVFPWASASPCRKRSSSTRRAGRSIRT
jgi:CO/xanthine dehydrogenase Mo-binding subunit